MYGAHTIAEELILPAAVYGEPYDRWVWWVYRICSNEI